MNFVNENIPKYGVSEISAAIKQKIEDSFGYVKIKGEVSGLAIKNGIAYLKIKENDDVINAIIFNSAYRQLKIKPQDGLEVVVSIFNPLGSSSMLLPVYVGSGVPSS